MEKEYYLGLDIGTDSVGYAVTDMNYKVQRFNQKAMWGVSLFEEAQQSAQRRKFRTQRKRNARKAQRVLLIQELFAKAIAEVDPDFYTRLKESFLYAEDKSVKTTFSLFADENYTDREYHRDYPTIHHLILKLMESTEPCDVRLLYLAVSYLVSHRGNFLFDNIDSDNLSELKEFDKVYADFLDCMDEDSPWHTADVHKLGEALIHSDGVKQTEKEATIAVFGGVKPKNSSAEIMKALAGGKFKLSVAFDKEEYEQSDKNSISFRSSSADDDVASVLPYLDDDADTLLAMKKIYDWSVLMKMLDGGTEVRISKVKVSQYEKHKSDLKTLKYFVKKYVPERYREVFSTAYKDKANYVAYSKNIKGAAISDSDYTNANAEAFCDYIKKLFGNITLDESDAQTFATMLSELEEKTFCPKQRNSDNGKIPHQLFEYELKLILKNARTYCDFLNEKDSDGLTVCDKILSVFSFRIPYYVGPLSRCNNKNAWIKRKEGRILPWNFDEMVDKDASEELFIKRMTRKCSYLAGEDEDVFVLPKNSLLYGEFTVLNIINKICYDHIPLTVSQKQELYEDLFINSKRKVDKKAVLDWLKSKEIDAKDITGMEDDAIPTLKSYHDFKRLLENKILTTAQAEQIIAHITITTDRPRLKKWLEDNFELQKEDIDYLSRLKYTEYGRLSEKFLTALESPIPETGEMLNIIRALRETNHNLMELLSSDFMYMQQVEEHNKSYYAENEYTLSDMLDSMYVSSAVRRAIHRTLDIVHEIRSIKKCDPKKIFIEVAREKEKNADKKSSRKDQLLAMYKDLDPSLCGDDFEAVYESLKNEDNKRLQSKRIYLYYQQLGKSMYTGLPIDLGRLSEYDIDHIYPQSRVKDDSFDNMVLVEEAQNRTKSDTFPLSSDIQKKMRPFWTMLHSKGLISKEKFYRLTRTTSFKDEELSGFINRQLVETRQSTKAVATILKDQFPNSEIVYVKAHLASNMRDTFHFPKSREVNDLHHAKDAYLNIVVGNVYHVKFTANPLNFIREKAENRRYTLKLTDKENQGLLSHDIVRNGEVAWRADGSSLATVRRTMAKNDINYVRYTFHRKGGLFKQTIHKASHNENDSLFAIKGEKFYGKELPTAKYGGYGDTTASCFTLVKHEVKGKTCVSILPVELLVLNKFMADDEFALAYLKDKFSLVNPQFAKTNSDFLYGRKIIRVNTMFEFENGFRATIAGKDDSSRISIASATSLIVPQSCEAYIKRLESKLAKAKENRTELAVDSDHDKITAEQNLELYDVLLKKCSARVYSGMSQIADVDKHMTENRETFMALAVEEQVKTLMQIVYVFKTGRTSQGCDLRSIGGSKNSAKNRIPSKLNRTMYIVDQSPTGLFERKSDNLLDI